MAPASPRSRCQSTFEAWAGPNGDGRIGVGHLKRVLARLESGWDEQKSEWLISHLEIDGSGQVSFAAFLEFVFRQRSSVATEAGREPRRDAEPDCLAVKAEETEPLIAKTEDDAQGKVGVKGRGKAPAPLQPAQPAGKSAGKGRGQQSATGNDAPEPLGPSRKVPVPKMHVLDLEQLWIVAGAAQPLSTDAAFQAAFDSLGSEVPATWRPITREKFSTFPGWKQKQLLVALANDPVYAYEFPHKDVSPLSHLEGIGWDTIAAVELSSTGSEGVVFVELAQRACLCVKAPKQPAAEVFGATLCRRLGIRCPQMRCIARASEEGHRIVEALIAADARRLPEQRRVTRALSNGGPVLILYEYLRARELADLVPCQTTAEICQRIFGSDPLSASVPALTDRCRAILRTCGAVLAFDMVIHNFDRLPCIWENHGNPQNLMLNIDSGDLIAIDNHVSCIPHGEIREKYLEKVRATTRAVAGAPEVEHPAFARVRTFLKEGCPAGHGWPGLGVDVGPAGTVEVQAGFLSTIRRATLGAGAAGAARARGLVTQESLSNEAIELAILLAQPGAEGAPDLKAAFECIDCGFCGSVLAIFREALLAPSL